MTRGARALVIGARRGSLGNEIATSLMVKGCDVMTAGISEENYHVDLTDDTAEVLLGKFQPSIVVCTVGVNVSAALCDPAWDFALEQSMQVNFVAPMKIIRECALSRAVQRVILVSSNSAHIARRNSSPYCASKAALSMGIRCAARELAGRPLVWGYEFGLLRGTPMTQQTELVFGPAQSRMVGAEGGLEPRQAADQVARDALGSWHGLNGTMLRLDAGEQ